MCYHTHMDDDNDLLDNLFYLLFWLVLVGLAGLLFAFLYLLLSLAKAVLP